MWWTVAVILVAWCVIPLPLAVAIGRAFAAGEMVDEPVVAQPRIRATA
ncbi:hypothetical protein FB382_000157 [Nocardioides ginsengisegetis]|uniref:Uncharacterized protein n=1 Tax=Nocardioides ginsengisegetis TaxID=661491 RepID=A0A7W3P800_9ACTN|nr:hypothetical protein [Nocardioides ginsengisegetis]MBA8801866.1 hypothetical protein [Nocardioides ginsengisegetis]